MPTSQTIGNPFALMMDPEAVFAALARSDRLGRLKGRICRPLDNPRPVPGEAGGAAADTSPTIEEADDGPDLSAE
jgi:hypothetical protein